MAIFAIGDLQACLDDFHCLLRNIKYNSDRDQLWLTGDIVNRGPKSLETLRYVKAMGDNVQIVLGNHDLHLLAVAEGVTTPKRKDTLDDILTAHDRDALLDWLRVQPLLHIDKEKKAVLVHAGILPGWSLDQAKVLAMEVEHVLKTEPSVFFHSMYGNQPAAWSETLKGMDRLRFITNVFTRMRYCSRNGAHLDLLEKSAPSDVKTDIIPWFQHPDFNITQDRIFFGHWSTLLHHNVHSNVIPLDTGCLWGGKLTACNVDTGEIHSVVCDTVLDPKDFISP